MSDLKAKNAWNDEQRTEQKSPGNKYLGLNLITLWILANHFNG